MQCTTTASMCVLSAFLFQSNVSVELVKLKLQLGPAMHCSAAKRAVPYACCARCINAYAYSIFNIIKLHASHWELNHKPAALSDMLKQRYKYFFVDIYSDLGK